MGEVVYVSLRGDLQGVQPVPAFNDILARGSLYIDGHVVFVPMEEQRNKHKCVIRDFKRSRARCLKQNLGFHVSPR